MDKDLHQALTDGDYDSKLPYYFGNETMHMSFEDKKAANNAHKADQARLGAQFKADALEYVGLTGHPKAGKVWDYAWQEGHSYGYTSVLATLEELAELVK